MESLVQYFGCGSIQIVLDRVDFVVVRLSDINTKIIPFFVKYPILGAKAKDFLDFCQAAKIMESKTHLTKQGFEKILILKQGMNRGRIV